MTARHVLRVAFIAVLSLVGGSLLMVGQIGVSTPAAAQFWGDPFFRPRPPRAVPQPQYQDPFGGFFQQNPWQQRTPRPPRQVGDSSKAPPPRKLDNPPTTTVVVLGDSMADWLAHGLEEAFADNNEIGVVRKIKPNVGLIHDESRRESTDWMQQARDLLASERPDFVVMMIGLSDRVPIRERAAAARPAQQNQPARQGQPNQPGQPAQPAQPDQQPPGQQAQQNAPAPEEAPAKPEASTPAPRPGTVTSHDFRSERWAELYGKRIDDTIAALKAKGVPVLWVGIAPVRGPRSRNDLTYLNDLFRARAQKAGITFVDVWDGFVDEDGNFSIRGPDYNGQIRQLRSADGVYFTKAGALKLGHYVEREIQRLIATRGTPLALPAPEPSEQTPAKPGVPAPRPVAGPVVPLTAATTAREELAGSGPGRAASVDPLAARVLTRGEAAPAAVGRADDFSWPRQESDDTIIPASLPTPPAPAVQRPGAKKGPAPAEKTQKKGPSQAANPPAAKQQR
jgi:hypothetical protein